MQADLFGLAVPSGLVTHNALISPEEEQLLIAAIDGVALEPFRFQRWTGKRLTHSFGWRYDFENGHFAAADPIPDFLLPLRGRAAAFAGLAADQLVQALVIRYDPGAGIGWHRDRPVFDHVVGISLGAAATLRLRRRRSGGFDRAAVALDPRAAYHLSGEARHQWEHSIVPIVDTRWSVTFRSLAGR